MNQQQMISLANDLRDEVSALRKQRKYHLAADVAAMAGKLYAECGAHAAATMSFRIVVSGGKRVK